MAGQIVLAGESALSFWRAKAGAAQVASDCAPLRGLRPPRASDDTYRQIRDAVHELGVPVPLTLLAQSPQERRNSALARYQLWRDDFWQDEAEIAIPGIWVCRPELALAQLVSQRGIVDALLAALEFCGTYLMAPAADAGFLNTSRPVLRPEELVAWFESRRPTMPCYAKRLGYVLGYVQARSNSPAESKVFAFLSLGRDLGGLGIPGIELNQTIQLGKASSDILGYPRMRPDFYIPAAHMAGEYKSKRFHPEATWSNDDKRMDALAAEGLATFSLNNERVRSLKQLNSIGLIIAKRLRLRRAAPTPEELKTRSALHAKLFLSKEFDGDDSAGFAEE